MNVGLVDSLKYGGKLFAYFLGVVILGGGGMALGGVLAIPELQTVIDSGSPDAATLAGGVIIGVLGVTIWFVGLFGLTYKFVVDAVSRGLETAPIESPTETKTEAPETTEGIQERAPETDQPEPAAGRPETTTSSNGTTRESPATTETTDSGRTDTGTTPGEPAAATRDVEPETTEPGEEPEQRERTAEEIAFGTRTDDQLDTETDDQVTEQREEPHSETDEEDIPTFEEIEDAEEESGTANSGSSRDPLAD